MLSSLYVQCRYKQFPANQEQHRDSQTDRLLASCLLSTVCNNLQAKSATYLATSLTREARGSDVGKNANETEEKNVVHRLSKGTSSGQECTRWASEWTPRKELTQETGQGRPVQRDMWGSQLLHFR